MWKCVHLAIVSPDRTGRGRARRTVRGKTAPNAFDGRLSATRQQLQPLWLVPCV